MLFLFVLHSKNVINLVRADETRTEKFFAVHIVQCCEQYYYGFGLSLDTRDSNAYVSRVKLTRCCAETAMFPRASFVVWSMVIRLFTF